MEGVAHEAGSSQRLERCALGILGGLVASAGLVWAFFSRRSQTLDDLALFNPSYMYLHYGVVTYPAYGQFDSMILHPPTHYWILGTLMKVGLEPFYAEAVPPVVFFLLAIWLILRSQWSPAIKAGLLVGLAVPFLSGGLGHPGDFIPRMRPETHFSLAWYAGLVALESARVKGWFLSGLVLGSTLLTYASTLHYPVALACLGVLVYVVLVLRERGLRHSSWELGALLVGPLVVGLGYLGFFVVPHWHEILNFIQSADRTGGPIASIGGHLRAYDGMYTRLNSTGPKLLLFPLSTGIPAILIGAGSLAVFRQTRGLAVASLPYPLFLLLGLARKYWQPGYYMPELMLYCASIGIVICGIAQLLVAIFMAEWRTVRALAPIGVAVFLAGALGVGSVFASVDISAVLTVQRHQAEFARAAARRILGPRALIGSRNMATFYASGATHYLDVAPDLLWTTRPTYDPAKYFVGFDALVEHPFMSHWTLNEKRESLVSWYLNGVLKLRGFFFSSELSELLLHTSAASQTEGYGRLQNGILARFLEAPSGDYRFIALQCDGDLARSLNMRDILRADYGLPGANRWVPSGWLVTLVISAKDLEASRSSVPRRCQFHQEIPLSLERVEDASLSQALAADPPIRFFADRESAMEARHGPEMVVQVNEKGWADVVQFVRGPRVGTIYRLASEGGRFIFRADGESKDVWQVNSYGSSGGLESRGGGPGRGDRVLVYTGKDPRDHLTTPFMETFADERSLILFTMWVKSEGTGRLPSVYLQDDRFSRLATAREVKEGADGWRLLAGWWPARSGGKLRVVITHEGRGTCLIDKAIVATVMATK